MFIEIQSCRECNSMTISPTNTMDSFERADDWHCKLSGGKIIAEWVCWNDKDPEIPDWCPRRVSKSIQRRLDIQTKK